MDIEIAYMNGQTGAVAFCSVHFYHVVSPYGKHTKYIEMGDSR